MKITRNCTWLKNTSFRGSGRLINSIWGLVAKQERIMSEKVRKHIIFYGRVQGVGFRYYSVYKSRQLGLTGWVRNLYDGTVEMEVQGETQVINQLIDFLNNQRFIMIEDIDIKNIPVVDDHDFYER